ncbi:hypothetical protein [Methylobacterium gossipiicola]|uniref:Uncharacterized protein n=1 Tax=Methylobacterium gossipiicola TaxID=582675 RepID=A0A1I2XPG9_9HYPH|nr:hypothetical protein [Methylobacterium gossipiicola]SFH14596.1 hypothetical protein SAMN05192565_1522 [Methylobacterium gossipiicola]
MPQIFRIQGQQPVQQSTLGDGIGKLGDALFGGDPAKQELLRQKAIEAQRLNEGNEAFQAGLRNAETSPDEMAALAAGSGRSGKELGEFSRYLNATKFGASDPRTSGAQIAAGQGLGDTFVGASMNDATTRRGQDVAAATSRANNAAQVGEQRYQFDNTPTNVLNDQGQSTVARRSESYGRAAPEQLGVVQGNAARNALTAGGGQIPDSTNAATKQFIGAERADATPEIVRMQAARDAQPAGSQNRAELDGAIRAKSISAGGEGTYDKVSNEALAKTNIGIQNDASSSTQREAMLNTMENLVLSGRVSSGAGSPYILAGKQLAAQLGVPLDGVADTEVFRAISGKMLIDLAPNGSLGGGLSNGDRVALVQQILGMANTPKGNLKIIGMLKQLERRKRDGAGWAAEYKAGHNGRLDGGWQAYSQQRAEASPLFGRSAGGAGPGR